MIAYGPMETAYRLTWNPRRPENRDDIEWVHSEGKVARWRCGNTKIPPGSRIYLMRLGQEPKGIIGVGIAGERSENDGDPYVVVTFDKLIEKSTDEPYIDLEYLKKKFKAVAWTNQNLAVRILGKVSQELEKRLLGEEHASARSRVSGTHAGVSRVQAKGTEGTETAQLAESLASGAGFGDPETNRRVESAAVIRVTEYYRNRGWEVLDVSREKRGYDLECNRGRAKRHVEVKGVAGGRQAIILTENERRQATEDRDFVLAVVTSALSEPDLHLYSTEEMFSRFVITPMIHRAILRDQDDDQRQGKSRRGR